jgi:hypothetical protein
MYYLPKVDVSPTDRPLYTQSGMTGGRRAKLIRIFCVLVLVGAILPNVTYVGHWSFFGLVRAEPPTADGHASHCHGDSYCTGGAASGLVWTTADNPTPSLDGAPERVEHLRHDIAPDDPALIPLSPPPRYA